MIAYVVGVASVVAGGLTAIGWLLSLALTSAPGRLRRATGIRPVTRPPARRRAWSKFGFSLALVLVGALFLLTARGTTPAWLIAVPLGLLLIWDFGLPLTARLRRHPAS